MTLSTTEETARRIHQEHVRGSILSEETHNLMVVRFQQAHPKLSLESCAHHLLVERLRVAQENP